VYPSPRRGRPRARSSLLDQIDDENELLAKTGSGDIEMDCTRKITHLKKEHIYWGGGGKIGKIGGAVDGRGRLLL